MKEEIRILIADDHPVVRHGLRSMLELKPGIKVVGEARDGQEAIQYAHELKPDVILMDLVMPKKDGLEAIAEIYQDDPKTRILMLTSFAEDDRIINALKIGAAGCLLKESTPAELLQAIQDVYQGKTSISPGIAHLLVQEMRRSSKVPPESTLTKRENEVFKMVIRGFTNQQIAAELFISEGTVRYHISNILGKLQVSNRTQAVLYALQQGWFENKP